MLINRVGEFLLMQSIIFIVYTSWGSDIKRMLSEAISFAQQFWQQRGMAEDRQIKILQYAFYNNIGLFGAYVIFFHKKQNNKNGGVRQDQTHKSVELEYLEQQKEQKRTRL